MDCNYCKNLKFTENTMNTTQYGKILEPLFYPCDISVGITEKKEWILHFETELDQGDCIINYCPMCGRSLID